MTYDPLVSGVAQELGLDLDSVGEAHVLAARRAARLRTAQRQAQGEASRQIEADELLEALVVPESWFFRDEAVFDHLGNHCSRVSGRVRVLSAPCARGEEAWSIAMTLARTGRPAAQMEVVGIDVSNNAITHARRGLYSGMSLRGQAASLAVPWMEERPEGMLVSQSLRSSVSLHQANMVRPLPWEGVTGSFDEILCRNLLIYLTPSARTHVLNSLHSLLRPDGLIFCGHAEGTILLQNGWLRDGAPETASFRMGRAETPARSLMRPQAGDGQGVRPYDSSSQVPARPFNATERTGLIPRPTPTAPVAVIPAQAPPMADAQLDRARAFADAGLYEQAREILVELLTESPEHTDAWTLRGMCELADNRLVQAADAFRQALLLEPRALDAMEGMAVVAGRQGRGELATSYRSRVAAIRGENE